MVQVQTGNFGATKTSIQKLLAQAPDNPELNVELAIAMVSAKPYDEATARLNYGVQKLRALGDKKGAAEAYARLSAILNADSSARAQKLQLEYLTASRTLYKEIGAQADEAETLVVIGDYYLKCKQNKSAVGTLFDGS